jgi:hypothetical protein
MTRTRIEPRRLRLLATGLALALFSLSSMAQRPPTSLFKCEEGGKVRYSDAPCQDGVKLNLNSSRPQGAAAAPPAASGAASGAERNPRRKALTEEAQRECAHLDADRRKLEDFEKLATGPARQNMLEKLKETKQRSKELRC